MNIDNLLARYDNSAIYDTKKITFNGVEGYDVYNITAPFIDDGKTIIAGRVEKRDSEDSVVRFFEKVNENTYDLLTDYPHFKLQDPYITFINNELVLGGTEIFYIKGDDEIKYHAIKLKGKNIRSLEKFFTGPKYMKDIRLLELNNNKILCLTRPQGAYGGRGKIGYLFFDSIDELDAKKIEEAPLLDLFNDEEWGGANELFKLTDQKVGVLGHIAKFDNEGNRHYYSLSFVLDLQSFETSDLQIILIRDDLEPGESKRPDLKDVIFSGGLDIINDNEAVLYVGVSDAEAHYAKIKNPFENYMK